MELMGYLAGIFLIVSSASPAQAGRDPARSLAAFDSIAKVLVHPRCQNCHPSGDSPLQGDTSRLHDPPVTRGPDDRGVPGMQCASCHQDTNLDYVPIPGGPDWHLAARSMAWAGKTPGDICRQIQDPARNGGRTLQQVYDHVATDKLVAWAWNPGAGLTPAPGSQEQLAALFATWIETGAQCPGGTPR